jgi:hypothetical protein
MLAEGELAEYLAQIRTDVCSRCPERRPGGPPCAPLGKLCGVEMHLPELIASIRQVQSPLVGPYLDQNRSRICANCALLHSSNCPCPMDYMAVLLVGAVEAVDRRHGRTGRPRAADFPIPETRRAWLALITRVYEQAAGTWTGCDWPTRFGRTGLDLNGWPAAAASARAGETAGLAAEDWTAATIWLSEVEHHAARAEAEAAMALQALGAGQWRQALDQARAAWALEFATGRPIWHPWPPAWHWLFRGIEAACAAFVNSSEDAEGRSAVPDGGSIA